MKSLSLLSLAVGATLMGCVSTQVTTDWDRNTSFASYHTYAWMETPRMQAMQQATLFDRRLRAAVEQQLAVKGMQKADANGEADLLIVYHAGVEDKLDVHTSGYFGRRVDVREYQQGMLVIDVVDARTKTLVWRATAKDEVGDADPSSDQIAKAVQKMFASFPQA
ncbi:MAG TPA: DUF4136 domain-containing protein [Gemmatimonadaceae bacterium]|nr:DUF4136 domain-containing protein [Gemmatimonadaceae bacterium]